MPGCIEREVRRPGIAARTGRCGPRSGARRARMAGRERSLEEPVDRRPSVRRDVERRTTSPSRARRHAGRSEAGSQCAIDPPTVPRLRTWTSPMSWHRVRKHAVAGVPATPAARRTSSAPRSRADHPRARLTPLSSASRPMSTSVSGRASRSFMSGSRLWPPASTLAPGRPRGSERLVERARPDDSRTPRGSCLASLRGLDRRPDLLWRVGHVEMPDPQRARAHR